MRDLSLYAGSRSRERDVLRRKAVILDIDGSLCDTTEALPHLRDRRDFTAFYETTRSCPPYQEAITYARKRFDRGYALLVLTAREQKWRELTCEWLEANFPLPYDGPFMRADGDTRPSHVFKREVYTHLSGIYDIRGALDDDPKVIDMWSSLGLIVTKGPGHHLWWSPDSDKE